LPSRRYLEFFGLESFGFAFGYLSFEFVVVIFVRPRNAVAKRGVFLYNENGIRRVLLAIKVAGGRTQQLLAESVCGYGFKRRACKIAFKTKIPGVEN